MVFFSSMPGTTMQYISTTFGAFRLAKIDQMQLAEVGSEVRNKKEKKEENEEEWIEVVVECPDCVKEELYNG